MKMKTLRTYLFLATICFGAWWPVSSAQAATLVGDSVEFTLFYPDLSTPVITTGPFLIAIGGTNFGTLGTTSINGFVSGLQIVLTPTTSYTAAGSVAFNGFDIRTQASTIGSVSLNASSGSVFSLSLDPGGHDIFVDLQGISLSPSNPIIVDLTVNPSVVPLPAAFPLFAAGLGVMGLFARRRKRKSRCCSRSLAKNA
jgi:hypothetical protein